MPTHHARATSAIPPPRPRGGSCEPSGKHAASDASCVCIPQELEPIAAAISAMEKTNEAQAIEFKCKSNFIVHLIEKNTAESSAALRADIDAKLAELTSELKQVPTSPMRLLRSSPLFLPASLLSCPPRPPLPSPSHLCVWQVMAKVDARLKGLSEMSIQRVCALVPPAPSALPRSC